MYRGCVTCPRCGRGIGCACHITFKDKVAGLSIAQAAMPNRTRSRYWDDEVINKQFGGDPKSRREQYLSDTDGLGHVQSDAQGRLWHKDRKTGEVEQLTEKQALGAVGGPG
jgi:hypothetical protein